MKGNGERMGKNMKLLSEVRSVLSKTFTHGVKEIISQYIGWVPVFKGEYNFGISDVIIHNGDIVIACKDMAVRILRDGKLRQTLVINKDNKSPETGTHALDHVKQVISHGFDLVSYTLEDISVWRKGKDGLYRLHRSLTPSRDSYPDENVVTRPLSSHRNNLFACYDNATVEIWDEKYNKFIVDGDDGISRIIFITPYEDKLMTMSANFRLDLYEKGVEKRKYSRFKGCITKNLGYRLYTTWGIMPIDAMDGYNFYDKPSIVCRVKPCRKGLIVCLFNFRVNIYGETDYGEGYVNSLVNLTESSKTGDEKRESHGDLITGIASDEKQFMTCSADSTLKIWEQDTGKLSQTLTVVDKDKYLKDFTPIVIGMVIKDCKVYAFQEDGVFKVWSKLR